MTLMKDRYRHYGWIRWITGYDPNKDLFDQLSQKLEHNLDNDANLFRNELTKLLEDDIIGRYYYQDGIIKHNIKSDKQIEKAIEVLLDGKVYASTLKGDAGLLSIN